MRELDLHKAKNADKSKQKNDAKNAKPKSVLEAFEYIVELAEDSNLDDDFLEKASSHIKYAAKICSPQIESICHAGGFTRHVC